MDSAQQHRLMLKILIGSAWADRYLAPEEVAYLYRILSRFALERDAELQELLKSPVAPDQTERWLIAYLKDSSDDERLKLLAAIGNLLISDEVVSPIEHDLLDEFHELMAAIPTPAEPLPSLADLAPQIVRQVRQFFRRVVGAR